MALNYKEKLLDPRWQKKRLEIMNRDQFKCVRCGNEKETLNVHHAVYINGAEPWAYNDIFLITVCNACHENEHSEEAESTIRLLEIGARVALSPNERMKLATGLRRAEKGFMDSLKSLIDQYGKEND